MAVDQLRTGSDNFAYIIHDEAARKAAVVDPGSGIRDIAGSIRSLRLDLELIICTHHHGDHTAGAVEFKRMLGGRIAAHALDAPLIPGVDLKLEDGDVLKAGSIAIEVIHTPGHTPGGICLLVESRFLLTGDTLFIGECGRCDLPGGSLEQMFHSLKRLGSLPDDLIVYPGHDYGPRPSDTLMNQKRTNYTMRARSIEEFSGL
ncbi:MAG: hydroxyacylglutathione hydrolase family protein [Candidatus Thermoplasmatota archaeon]|nr:hydroxyacylglutathione hydrolase family protein [Candidatus Thermoplasmatota archaeon]